MENKKCSSCGEEKEISNFSKKNKLKDGTQRYQPMCKICFNIQDTKRRLSKEYKEYKKEYDKEYNITNKEKISENKKTYHFNNRESVLEYKREYRKEPKNKERFVIYFKKYISENREKYYKYRRQNPHIIAWRSILYRTLKYLKKEKEGNTLNELKYTPLQLKEHLESQFREGMSWSNYGEWEIDHIKALTKFESTTLPCEVNALSNLQPLWKLENIKKYNN